LVIEKHLTLSPKVLCYKISTGIYGPLPLGTEEMVLRRNSLISQGFIVHPGIIDEDFLKNEIILNKYINKTMTYVKNMQFNTGDWIAQLLLFPYIKVKAA
jgi:dUTPase